MGCKCIYRFNEKLEKMGSNTRIDVPLLFNPSTGLDSQPRCKIVVCKADSKKRERARTVLASYCPICGKKY